MANPEVIISGFADEGPASKRAEEQLTMLRAVGMEYYSLRFVDVGSGVKNLMALTRREVKRLQKLHAEFGVQVSSIGSPLGKVKLLDVDDGTHNAYIDPKRYLDNDVPRAIERAHDFGAKLIRGFSFYPPKDDDPGRHIECAAERLAAIADQCKQAGLIYGLEVEANLVGRDGATMKALHKAIGSDNVLLIFDGANIVCQGFSTDECYDQYRQMKSAIGWLHIKDYQRAPSARWQGYVDEEMLKNFVPPDQGDAGHERILRDFRGRIPALTRKLKKLGVPGVFLDLEPHVKGGGQFGGFSGPDGFGVALRALCRVLDYVGIGYHLTDYEDVRQAKLDA